MERWRGKVAVVTGASAGIGWAIVKDLLGAGMQVVGMARRLQHMEELRSQLKPELREAFYPRECDLNALPSIKTAFAWVAQSFGGRMHVLVNNAGMAEFSRLLDEGNETALRRVIDVNLMGAVYCTKEAFRLMQVALSSEEECHVINVNSLLGHRVPAHIPACGFNLYPVAKHALLATNEILRRELYAHKLMRLSSISPGLTRTNFGTSPTTASDSNLAPLPDAGEILQPEDVSRGVLFILASPLHVTIAELLMVPSREQY